MTPFETAIAAFGATPETIMATLSGKGIRGNRHSCTTCPVARYLNACGFPVVSAGLYVRHYPSHAERDAAIPPTETVLLSKVLRTWMNDFDEGAYPEFEEES